MRTAFGIALAAWTFLLAGANAQTAGERANVRRIHDRIQQRGRKAAGKMQAYKVTIPNTAISYSMVPVPAGEFTMGSAEGRKEEQPAHKVRLDAFWMQAHEVTWDEYGLFMFASQGGEIAQKDEVVDAVSRPTKPYVEMSFGMGINGFPAISMTQRGGRESESLGAGHQTVSARGAGRLVERSGRHAALCGARCFRRFLEAAGPAIAEEHLVSHGCPVAGVPAGSAGESSERGRDVPVLEQRPGE